MIARHLACTPAERASALLVKHVCERAQRLCARSWCSRMHSSSEREGHAGGMLACAGPVTVWRQLGEVVVWQPLVCAPLPIRCLYKKGHMRGA